MRTAMAGSLSIGSTPKISPIPSARWNTFVDDPERQSRSFILPHSLESGSGYVAAAQGEPGDPDGGGPAFSNIQLDAWFQSLHPSSYRNDPADEAWTKSFYRGRPLLRETAWYVLGEACRCEYGYSDTWQPIIRSRRMAAVLDEITREVTTAVGLRSGELNCVNLNYYPAGGGVGWHADDEFLFDGLRREARIVSLSLCGTSWRREDGGGDGSDSIGRNWGVRKFQVRRKGKKNADDVREILLGHGDLMTMEGLFQKYYLHSVWPGDSKNVSDHPLCQGERINLTWRTIVRHLDGSRQCRGMRCPLGEQTDENTP